MTHPESQVALIVARYLQVAHPDVVYRFDLAADLKLTKGQAWRHKLLHPVRGFPDLMIYEPRNGYTGLALELKAAGVRVYKQDGNLRKDDHLAEQAAMLERLRAKGFRAEFASGSEEARQIIADYLGN